jgi:hypothetical protein
LEANERDKSKESRGDLMEEESENCWKSSKSTFNFSLAAELIPSSQANLLVFLLFSQISAKLDASIVIGFDKNKPQDDDHLT